MRRLLLLLLFIFPLIAGAQVTKPAIGDTTKPKKNPVQVDTLNFWRDSLFKDPDQRALKDGAVLRPPRPPRKIRKFKIRYSDRIQYNVLLDYPMTAAVGVPSVLTLQKQLTTWEDSLLPIKWRGDTTASERTWSALYRFAKICLIDAPIESALLSIESDLYGSMGRGREFKLKGLGYGFTPPYPLALWTPMGTMKYDQNDLENQASRMQLAQVAGAALDAGNMASEQLTMRWMQRKSMNYRESLHFLRAQLATMGSIMSLSETPEMGKSAAGDWLYYTNRQYGHYDNYYYTAGNMKRDFAIATLTNPNLYSSLYSVFYKYMIQGKDSMATPAIKLGYGKYVLPWVRMGFTPFGAEWIPSIALTKHRQMIQLYGRVGTSTFSEAYGGGVKLYNIKRSNNFSLNAHVSIWKQRHLYSGWTTQTVDPVNWGGAAIVSGNYLLNKSSLHPMSLAFQAGYKTRGYMEGEVWEASPVIKVGLSWALDRDYVQDDTVPEYFTITKQKKKKSSSKKHKKSKRR